MAEASIDLVALAVQLTQTAMGDKGGWIGSDDQVIKFVKAIHKTLVDLKHTSAVSITPPCSICKLLPCHGKSILPEICVK
jgi:hypothetical protein